MADAKEERKKSAKEMGARVKELREKKELTQRQLATYVGVGQQSIGEIESGQIMDPKCIDKLSSVLGVSVAWLRYGKEDDISPRSRYVAERLDGLPEKSRNFVEELVELIDENEKNRMELLDLREMKRLLSKSSKSM